MCSVQSIDVAIIGAGPYGLSLAAHLNAEKINFRIFGIPLDTWQRHMPQGMVLKSVPVATNFGEPTGKWTFQRFCARNGINYSDVDLIKLNDFCAYGLEFQRQLVPNLEQKLVTSLKNSSGRFELTLDDGETLTARRVVVAVGTQPFAYLPPVLKNLPESLVTHTSYHSSLDRFKGKKVAVLGGGASAVDAAVLAHEAGAQVQLFARKPIHFSDTPKSGRSIWQRMVAPWTPLGVGWKFAVATEAPWLFRYLRDSKRVELVKRVLGPSAGPLIKQRVVGVFPVREGFTLVSAEAAGDRLRLEFKDASGTILGVEVDHLIAGTGFELQSTRIPFMAPELAAKIKTLSGSPELSARFESTVRGLYFMGLSSAISFGPLMRFIAGAPFSSKRLSRVLRKGARRNAVAVKETVAAAVTLSPNATKN